AARLRRLDLDTAVTTPGQGVPSATQAAAGSANGPDGNSSAHRARNRAAASGDSPARYAPAGPTPYVNGSHQSSKPSTGTEMRSTSCRTSRRPASVNSDTRCPTRAPASAASPGASGSSVRAARQNADSGD